MLLQMGFPGGLELLVVLVIALLVFGLPLVLLVVVGALWLRSDDDYDERIRELESDIARLQAEVTDGGTDETDAAAADSGSDEHTADGGADARE